MQIRLHQALHSHALLEKTRGGTTAGKYTLRLTVTYDASTLRVTYFNLVRPHVGIKQSLNVVSALPDHVKGQPGFTIEATETREKRSRVSYFCMGATNKEWLGIMPLPD